jgi:hypothetical protein
MLSALSAWHSFGVSLAHHAAEGRPAGFARRRQAGLLHAFMNLHAFM